MRREKIAGTGLAVNGVGGVRGAASKSLHLCPIDCLLAGRNRRSSVGNFSDVRDSIPCTLIEIKASRRVAPYSADSSS